MIQNCSGVENYLFCILRLVCCKLHMIGWYQQQKRHLPRFIPLDGGHRDSPHHFSLKFLALEHDQLFFGIRVKQVTSFQHYTTLVPFNVTFLQYPILQSIILVKYCEYVQLMAEEITSSSLQLSTLDQGVQDLNILPIETFNSKTRTCRFNKVSVFSLPKCVLQIRTHVLQLKFAKSSPSLPPHPS